MYIDQQLKDDMRVNGILEKGKLLYKGSICGRVCFELLVNVVFGTSS